MAPSPVDGCDDDPNKNDRRDKVNDSDDDVFRCQCREDVFHVMPSLSAFSKISTRYTGEQSFLPPTKDCSLPQKTLSFTLVP